MSAPGPRPAPVSPRDSIGMLDAVAAMAQHVREGYAAGRGTPGLPAAEGVRSVAICGMGGSGIPGDIVRALLQQRMGVPIVVSKGYALPEFCHTDTLLFAVSYSGNTEETVAAYREGLARGCRAVAVCSGGELTVHARDRGMPVVPVSASFPAPRAAVAFLTLAVLGAMEAIGLAPVISDDVEEAAAVLEEGARRAAGPDGDARAVATRIGGRVPMVWGSEGVTGAAALRWKTDVNENAKRPAFASTLPELDHNEIEGWSAGTGGDFFLVVLRAGVEHSTVGARVEATLRAIEGSGLEHDQVWASGERPLAQALSLVQLGGFVSCHLALDAGADPGPIERIEALKTHLRGGS